MAACNVALQQCKEARKGKGIFASHDIEAGAVVGTYLGERLSQRQYAIRHLGEAPSNKEEIAFVEERRSRISLTKGGPMKGIDNRGAYVFELLPSRVSFASDRIAYIDAEDPNRW